MTRICNYLFNKHIYNLEQYKEALKDYKKALELELNNEYAMRNMQGLKK